jgi:hypothetical protein
MRVRAAAVRLVALAGSLIIFLATGEIALRLIYRDGGRRTPGAPGGQSFTHLTTGPGELRGRLDLGPRQDGIPRLMIVGDSITYGGGVRDWRQVWPERLAVALERSGRPHEMAVFAFPGRDMLEHLAELEQRGPEVSPDVLIYQWYVNDIEVIPGRPDFTRAWHRWRSHDVLSRASYLYYFLDHQASTRLPPPQRSYAEYIVDEFAPGTARWAEFERHFHAFAVRGRGLAKRRIMLLYPQVPYRGPYPLEPIHARMRASAGRHTLAIPPSSWRVQSGALEEDASAPWKQALRVAGVNGPAIETSEYLMESGEIDAEVTVSVTDGGGGSVRVATLDVVSSSGEVLSSEAVVVARNAAGYHSIPVRLRLPGDQAQPVRFRVTPAAGVSWRLAGLGVAVDYGFEVIDLAEPLNQFNTHVSVFDAHPNEAAHQAIAEHVYRALTRDARQP